MRLSFLIYLFYPNKQINEMFILISRTKRFLHPPLSIVVASTLFAIWIADTDITTIGIKFDHLARIEDCLFAGVMLNARKSIVVKIQFK
mmetsp:Transcript_17566/g.38388  ORF Transcript_17566/g.38388 Transcript_17566/m.38388 type:complete len:89 (+) Transcript_17566:1876-2142(+)